MNKEPEPVFIVGSGRSGTTLLKDLMNSNSDIKFPPESHFLLEFYKLFGDPRNEKEAVGLMRHIRRHYRYKRFGLDIKDAEIKGFRKYNSLIDYIYTRFSCKYKAKRWGEKTPYYMNYLEDIKSLFPSAKFIHIIRDGRDMALSVIATAWGPNNVYTAAKYWKEYVEAGIKARDKLKESYMEVKYEDLLENPESVLRKITSFTGLTYSPDMLKLTSLKEDGYIANTRNFFGRNTSHRASDKKIVKRNTGNWKKKMKESDIKIFNFVAGDLLKKLGYEVPYKNGVLCPGRIKRLYYGVNDFVFSVFNEITSKDMYLRMVNPDIFPVIRSSKRILNRKKC
ncbi:MAG: sulfotransferase [Candidatus Omnitrophica bacterium]|nr:sulfotransferase [Candidatus Omnitrophota bacterium]